MVTGSHSGLVDKLIKVLNITRICHDRPWCHLHIPWRAVPLHNSWAPSSPSHVCKQDLTRTWTFGCTSLKDSPWCRRTIAMWYWNTQVQATLYRWVVGLLIFLTRTRPNILFATNLASRYMQNPQLLHLQVVHGIILGYFRTYPDYGLFCAKGEEGILRGYSDANYAQDADDMCSTGRYMFFLGKKPISWSCKMQSTTSRSSCESEYRALCHCICEAIWLRLLLQELGIDASQPTFIGVDN